MPATSGTVLARQAKQRHAVAADGKLCVFLVYCTVASPARVPRGRGAASVRATEGGWAGWGVHCFAFVLAADFARFIYHSGVLRGLLRR